LFEWLTTDVTQTATGTAQIVVTWPAEIIGHSRRDELVLKDIPTDNNYYNITNAIHCYPNSGGSGTFSGTSSVMTIASSTYHTSNTSGGSPPCNETGTYYFAYRDATASTTILYLSQYGYNVDTQQFTFLGYPTSESTICTDCTRIISTNPNQGDSIPTTTPNKLLHIEYYLNPDDYQIGDTYAKVTVTQVQTQTCSFLVVDNLTQRIEENTE